MFVRKMFWGRGSWYKNSFHAVVIGLTAFFVVSGLFSTRYQPIEEESQTLSYSSAAYGNNDLLQQGSSIASVVAIEKVVNYQVLYHKVKAGESLDDIAKKYGVSKNTIKWANEEQLSPFHDNVNVGVTLRIPEMNGVLMEVEEDDTLDSIVAETSGNKFDIIEINSLVGPNYDVQSKRYIFVPNGKLPDPIPSRAAPTDGGYISPGFTGGSLAGLPAGFFDDPLSHPACAGYSFGRGFRPGGVGVGHTGVDLLKAGGCPIRAVGNGVVTFAGWQSGTGFAVTINHGNGVESLYYHGDGNIWVTAGQTVSRGQPIMYMGCTGLCFGTHLHLTIRLNGALIDPAPYVPYRR